VSYKPPAAEDSRLRLAVKDFIDVQGMVTTAGSAYLARTSPPAQRDADCLSLARAEGVNIVGKTNASEFGVTASGINPHFGTPRSPLSLEQRLITGGSSSGSAVAVATGMADVAFGTDTGGSVRIPAAFCGVYGMKTTHGSVSLRGVFPMSPRHLDTVGPLAANLENLERGMNLLHRDFPRRYARAKAQFPSARSIRVGRLYVDGTDPAVDSAVDRALRQSGFVVVPLNRQFHSYFAQAQQDGRTIAVADAYLHDQQYLDKPGISSVTEAAILLGRVERQTNYEGAVAEKRDWQRVLNQVFDQVDMIALPTMKQVPPRIPLLGSTAVFEARVFGLQNTIAFNYSGTPALAIPIPIEGKPVLMTSLQLAGPRMSEAELLNAARFLRSKPQ
jgi:Asp-tRNA(Asn)/Glu-tRNA(Gln) amidotransferase A subunit family amidase